MAYSVSFKRKKRPSAPMTPKRAAIICAWLLVAIVLAWTAVKATIYAKYVMVYPHSNATWGRQTGSAGNDDAASVAVDRHGNVYVAGTTDGALYAKNAAHTDLIVVKYSAAGDFIWGRQFGAAGDETVGGIVTDTAGNVYVAGGTDGSLFGASKGDVKAEIPTHDAYLVKIDPSGKKVWATQLGAAGDDSATGLAIDQQGNVYVCGDTDGDLFAPNADKSAGTSDVWEAKYSSIGEKLWATQFGAADDDEAESIAVDAAGDSFIAGGTHALFQSHVAGRDVFLAKINAGGKVAWGQQLPVRQNSFPAAVACDSDGYSYLAADMIFGQSILNSSPSIAMFYPAGILKSRIQMNADLSFDVLSAVPDSKGGLTLIGSSNGHARATDVVGHAAIARYTASGRRQWSHQLPGPASSLFDAVVIDPGGYAYAAGKAEGSLYAKSGGSDDLLVVKMGPAGQLSMPSTVLAK